MSGAAVFAEGGIIGVIVQDAPRFGPNALRAARAEAFLNNTEMSQFLCWNGYLPEVQAPSGVLASGVAKPVVIGLIPQEPPSFQSRPDLLTVMTREPSKRGSPTVFAVTGIRGVGKSQLAAACARQRLSERWRVVAWVAADDPGQLREGFGQIAAELKLSEGVQDAGESSR